MYKRNDRFYFVYDIDVMNIKFVTSNLPAYFEVQGNSIGFLVFNLKDNEVSSFNISGSSDGRKSVVLGRYSPNELNFYSSNFKVINIYDDSILYDPVKLQLYSIFSDDHFSYNDILEDIISVFPVIISVLIGFIGLRKAINFLINKLKI